MAAKKKTSHGKRGNPNPKTEHLKQTQWKPGQSGNPAGRPPDLLSDAYRALLARIVEADRHKRTYAELIAEGQARAAIKGSTFAAKEIADRTEGKAKESIEITGKGGAPVSFELNVRFVDENKPTKVRSEKRE